MEQNTVTSIREMLEQLPTETLAEMFRQELQREEVDGEAIRLLNSILRSRTSSVQVEFTPEMLDAVENYPKKTARLNLRVHRKQTFRKKLLRLGSAAAIVVLLLTMFLPQEAGAETLWQRFTRWTTGIVEFFSSEDNEDRFLEYEFKTDNPGLQQVYDAVVEMGITVPVVPTWLPEGSELLECKRIGTSRTKGIFARFTVVESELIFQVDTYDTEYAHDYHKTDVITKQYENSGIVHTITQNNDRWLVIWNRDNIECCITVDCQEETLYEILKSIYVMEAQ